MNFYQDIKINDEEARHIVADYYAMDADVTSLNGEIDFNFLIINGEEKFILKVSRPDFDPLFVDFQDKILEHLEKRKVVDILPTAKLNIHGQRVFDFIDHKQRIRKVRMLHWIEGELYSSVHQKDAYLRNSLGAKVAMVTAGLVDFSHPHMSRQFDWDIAQGLWIEAHIDLCDNEMRPIIQHFIDLYKSQLPIISTLRKSVIHNDANDNNLIVATFQHITSIVSLIDFGDAIYSHTINDLAVTIAYGVMDCTDPLQAACDIITSYHETFPIEEQEIDVLFGAVAMRLCISLTKSAINKIKEPDNVYLQISEKQAVTLIRQWKGISLDFATYRFRHACGYVPCRHYAEFVQFSKANQWHVHDILLNCTEDILRHLDLSIDSKVLGNFSNFISSEAYGEAINRQREKDQVIFIGGYGEARPVYTTDAYKIAKNEGYEHRTIHMGIDLWSHAGHEVCTPMQGVIVSIYDNDNDKDYGPTIIIEHTYEELTFYTLYGHLSKESLHHRSVGERVVAGDIIGFLGDQSENGNWAPHLHFQILLDRLDTEYDFYGVSLPSYWPTFSTICPDPNLLLKLPLLDKARRYTQEEILTSRKTNLGKSLSISYNKPLTIVRGQMQYLMDDHGQKYIDTVNNVAHVGHEHPRVIEAGINQMRLLNTNTRYLNEEIVKFGEELLQTFPPDLCVVHFVNSGSEANELAMRMARSTTKQKDVVALEIGYHGNTQGCIDISSYKFNGKGGAGQPDYTSIVPLPDQFRGIYRGEDTGVKYANHVKEAIDHLQSQGRNISAFIAESIVSCGGQIPLPTDYLQESYRHVRAAGGLCISDEVQVGFGRVGKHFWGFELYGVIPDIVTLGKPIGNGHPLGAVVCTRAVAEAFANGMEYFNTFGGNPVSCAIGREVLQVVHDEHLQAHALHIGNYLKQQFRHVSKDYPILADVRGEGLFLGIEFVDEHMHPLTETTSFISNKMKDYNILMSVDGPYNNVLKIKPPMCFDMENAEYLLECLVKVLAKTRN